MSYAILQTMVGRPIDTTVEIRGDAAFLGGLSELRKRLADARNAAMDEDDEDRNEGDKDDEDRCEGESEDEAGLFDGLEDAGFEQLYEGSRFFGVLVEGGEFDVCCDAIPAAKLQPMLVATDDETSRARALCDALPDVLKAHPALMPFGTYLIVGYS